MSSSSLNVDQRIVQMQFDNAQFEQGVSTTMGTLDKLKQSLNFTGQANALDGVSKSINSFSAAPIVSAMETAKGKFTALEVAAITAISNITTRIQMMGERLVKAITIDPLKSGWSEYEEKMDSIKTILNSAKDENGMAVSLDQVKKKIEELNVYADKTIYSFSDMTNNIGKFTNAGVDLDTSVAAIQGVANAAAAAGADSNAASRAMYNFAQALSTGFIQRIDWKSIENANMATVEFKDELLKTAVELGTVKKEADGTYMALTSGSKTMKESAGAAAMFTENLATQWLSNDVLIKTLNKYSDATTEIGKKAQEAATRVFTFSKMVDTLGESLQSGWSATWEKIVGDYEQAGDLFTGINNYISGIFDANANKRVAFLDKLLNNLGSVKKRDWLAFDAAQENKKDLETYIEVVKKVAREHHVDIDSMIKDHKTFEGTLKEGWFTKDIMDDVNKYINGLSTAKKAGEQLYSKEQVQYLKSLTGTIKEGTNQASAYTELMSHAGKTGRELILESFTALFKQVERIFKHIGAAYNSIFPKTSVARVYDALKAFHEFATNFKIARQMRKDIRRTFKGIFSIFDIFKMAVTAIGKGIGTIIKHVAQFSGSFLGLTSNLGMSIMALRNWIKDSKIFDNAVNSIVAVVCTFLDAIRELHILDYIKNSLSLIANILVRIAGFVISLAGTILSSKAFAIVLNTILAILLKVFYVLGNIIPWTIQFIKYLLSLPKVSSAVKGVQDFFKSIASYAYSGLITVLNKIHDFIDYVSSSSGLQYIANVLSGAVLTLIGAVSAGASKVKTFVGDLLKLDSVQNIIQNLKEFFTNFKDNIKTIGSNGLDKIKDFFKMIGTKLPDSKTVLETINGLLDGSIDKSEFIQNSIDNIHKGLKKILDKIKEIAKTKIPFFGNDDFANEADAQGNTLETAGDKLKNSMRLFVDKIKEGFSYVSSGKLFSIAAWATTIFIFVQLGRAIGALGKVIRGFSFDAKTPIGKFLRAFTKDLNASANETNAKAFETLAKGIGIIALSLATLTSLDSSKLTSASAGLFIILLGIRMVVNGIAKIFENKLEPTGNPLEDALSSLATKLGNAVKKGLKIVALGAAFAGVAIGLFLLVAALKNIYEIITAKDFNWKALAASGVIIVAFLAAIIAALKIMNTLKIESTKEIAATILAFGAAIWILVDAMKSIPTNFGAMMQSLFGLAVTMGILLGSMYALSKIGSGDVSLKELTASMLLLAVAINLLVIPLALLSLIPPERIIAVGAALLLLTIGMGALMAVTKMVTSNGGNGVVKTILGVSLAMLILSNALGSLAEVPVDNLKAAGIAMGILVAALMVLGVVANVIGPGLIFLGKALFGFGVAAAGFGVAAYLIVSAIGMIGPALDSLITGFISFSEKLVNNAPIILAGIVSLIDIICTAILVKKALLSKTAFSVFMGLFEGGQAAILSMLPKSKVLIITLVLFLLGVLDTIIPGAVSKILGIIARAIDSLAKAIATKSGPLVSAVFHLIGALGILILEIFQQIFEGINEAIKSITGGLIDLDKILPGDPISSARTIIENMKTDLTKSIDENSEAISKSYEEGAEEIGDAAEKWSSATNVDNAKQEQINEKRHQVDSPEESYQYGYSSGEAEVQGQADGATSKASSLNLDLINSLFDKDGMLDASKMTGFEVADIFGKGFSSADLTSFMNGESSEMFKSLESNLGGDKLGQLTDWASKEMEGNFDLSGMEKEADETAEHIKEKNKEIAKSTPEVNNKEEKITKKTTVKTVMKVDNSSSKTVMKKDAEETANVWQKTFAGKGDSIKNTVTSTLKSAAKGAGSKSIYTEFRNSASYTVNGFLNGLGNKMDDMYQKGYQLGKKVDEGYRAGQKIQSPSKVSYKSAMYTVQGMLNAFDDSMRDLYKAGAGMGGSVTRGTREALGSLTRTLSSDIDSTPTIRPVLDLSDVARGAGQINGMLNGRTLSVNGFNANNIAASMNARQNGTDPVVTAISDLTRALSTQQPVNTYNINGITYDDGSNIASAIGMLARAAVVEGRA